MRDIFIGPLRYWLILVAMLVAMWTMGSTQFHISDFKLFLLVLIGLSAAAVAAIVFTYGKGERVTRDPLDDAD